VSVEAIDGLTAEVDSDVLLAEMTQARNRTPRNADSAPDLGIGLRNALHAAGVL